MVSPIHEKMEPNLTGSDLVWWVAVPITGGEFPYVLDPMTSSVPASMEWDTIGQSAMTISSPITIK